MWTTRREVQHRTPLIPNPAAAFSPTCSQGHIPKYVTKARGGSSAPVYVIAVNDAFVMNAWHESLDPQKDSGVHFVADPAGEYVKKLDLLFDATGLLGNHRAHRFAIAVKDGKVQKLDVEPDPTQVTTTSAERVL